MPMFRLFQVMIVVISASSIWAADRGSIKGKVEFVGVAPTAQPFKITGDSYCEAIHETDPIRHHEVVVNPNQTLANVIVYIARGGPDDFYGQPVDESVPAVTLTQEQCQFSPRIVALRTGQRLEVRNNDDTIQNINALPAKNRRFSHSILPGGDPVTLTFDEPEVGLKLKSDIHPWMVSLVGVFDHPAFYVTGDDGTFELTGLPQGEYLVEAWHEKFGVTEVEVLVQADAPTEIRFVYTDQGSKAGNIESSPVTTSTLTAEEL